MPLSRHIAANAVALAPSAAALVVLWWLNEISGAAALLAFCGIGIATVFLVQRYLGALERFARFVSELSGEREPAMPRLAFAPAAEELARAAATLATGWRRQRANIDNLAASAQAIVDGLPDALIGVDRQRRIVRTNRAATAMLGRLGTDRDLSTALRYPQLLSAVDELLETGPDGNFAAADSSTVAFVLTGAPDIDVVAHLRRLPRAAADGSLALIVLHDTTALRRAERMRADFVANASHELKTPIAGLAGFIETLRGPAKDDPAARERFLAIMAEQSDRMRRLVDDLLMLSRIEQHEHARPDGHVELGRVLASVQDLLQLKANQRNVRLELEVEPSLAPAVGDADELTIVFQNLVDNAIKYARASSTV
ncbi:MAG TPA: histidine kinase dimerization/phospho-acceptor domain-containing protein, partial [Reyranellaceae bacterium]|nr:histidine kinase dimerization/phospho-acceptor domain-containing protein [Reyranellaceae bacterium]